MRHAILVLAVLVSLQATATGQGPERNDPGERVDIGAGHAGRGAAIAGTGPTARG